LSEDRVEPEGVVLEENPPTVVWRCSLKDEDGLMKTGARRVWTLVRRN
jgi:hypothetical protein